MCYLIDTNEIIMLSVDTVDVSKITRIDLKKDKPKINTAIMEDRVLGIFNENRTSSSSFYYYTPKKIFKGVFNTSSLVDKRMNITISN